jgi:hypothetical protein
MRSDRYDSSTAAGPASPFAWRGRAGTAGALLLALLSTASARAQTSHFLACTPGALANCAEVLLTSTPGGGTGGATLFEIALRNAGSSTQPGLPTSVYNLVFGTGLPSAAPGSEVSELIVPVPVGGATLTDVSGWDLFESGNALFLSALSNNGVGGCVPGAPVGGFGQAGNSCGSGQYLTFSFSTPRLFDPRAFSVLDLEVVGLAPGLPADSCGERPACVIAPVVGTVPEPAMLPLLASGAALLAGTGARRRRRTPIRRAPAVSPPPEP